MFTEFKELFRYKKRAFHTLTRTSNLYTHGSIPPSLKNKPPKLKLTHHELNHSLQKDFLALTNQYNKELTTTYISHLDRLVHAYTKLLDDFPNMVRKELYDFSTTLLDPKNSKL